MQTSIPRYPERLTEEQFYPVAYRYMYCSRRAEERLVELFRKGYVKGTVTLGVGNEATAVGMGLPLRSGTDVVSILHRDFATHLVLGSSLYDLLCQYAANADSPTHGREGNVHHGRADLRRFPMMSHLGNMLSLVVGGVWAARRQGEEVFGLAVIGDGGSSTGDFHESLNLASVRKAPVVFLIENNHYAFSTPTALQYNCSKLSDRAAGYGIGGRTIDGTDAWEVYRTVCDALDEANRTSLPQLIESMTLRLGGHAAYDKGEYVTQQEQDEWMKREPLGRARRKLAETSCYGEEQIAELEQSVDREIEETVRRALAVARPDPLSPPWHMFAEAPVHRADPFISAATTNHSAVTMALDYLLGRHPECVLLGLDIGPYGSAFKTCKGLYERYGRERVIDMPLCESALVGFSLGASQTGGRPILEFQFADFSTESATQLGLNCGTWFFRSGRSAQVLFRLPCGGGITLGAFHSGEFEGVWSRFPGLKLLYPATPQETFEALVAGFYDPNPCLVFEHKLLYTRSKGPIDFDGDLDSVWTPRRHAEGTDVTVVALGAMVEVALEAAGKSGVSAEIWNPFVLSPLNVDPILESTRKTGRLLVVQESTETGGLADRFVSLACRKSFSSLRCPPVVVGAPDTPIPFAPELESRFRPDTAMVSAALRRIVGED